MSLPTRATVTMRDFPGLMAEMDELDLEGGSARLQVNLVCSPGSLEIRGGIKRLLFEDNGEVLAP